MLGEDLVGGADARGHAGPGVGDPHHLEQLLHRPVLAVAAVKRDERDLGSGCAQPVDQVRADVDLDHLVPEARERVLDPRPGFQ